MQNAFEASHLIVAELEESLLRVRKKYVADTEAADLTLIQCALVAAFSAEYTRSVLRSAPDAMRPLVAKRIEENMHKFRERLFGYAPPVREEKSILVPSSNLIIPG